MPVLLELDLSKVNLIPNYISVIDVYMYIASSDNVLVDYQMLYVPLRNFSLIRRRHR
jgi:hypothetical protein